MYEINDEYNNKQSLRVSMLFYTYMNSWACVECQYNEVILLQNKLKLLVNYISCAVYRKTNSKRINCEWTQIYSTLHACNQLKYGYNSTARRQK